MKTLRIIIITALLLLLHTFSNAQTDTTNYGGQEYYNNVWDSVFVHIPFDSLEMDYFFNRSFTIIEPTLFALDTISNIQLLSSNNK